MHPDRPNTQQRKPQGSDRIPSNHKSPRNPVLNFDDRGRSAKRSQHADLDRRSDRSRHVEPERHRSNAAMSERPRRTKHNDIRDTSRRVDPRKPATARTQPKRGRSSSNSRAVDTYRQPIAQGGRTLHSKTRNAMKSARGPYGTSMQTPPFGGSAKTLGAAISPKHNVATWIKRFAILFAILALAWALINLFTATPSANQDIAEGETQRHFDIDPALFVDSRLASYASFENLDPKDLDVIPETTEVTGFTLSEQQDNGAPAISEKNAVALQSALEPFTSRDIKVGFAFMDIETGRGFAYNIDDAIYGASSFKGPFCAYYASTYIDNGYVNLSKVSDNLFNTIVYSNNLSYWNLRKNMDDSDVASWLATLGIDTDVAYDTNYPTYTVRDSAKLWLAVHDYLEDDTSAAKQLRKFFSNTETSFLRRALCNPNEDTSDIDDYDKGDGSADANELFAVEDESDTDENTATTLVSDSDDGGEILIEPANENLQPNSVIAEYTSADGRISVVEYPFLNEAARTIEDSVNNIGSQNISVFDKAGWYPRDENDVSAMVDAGIVECNGRDFLLCAMTEMSWSSPNRKTFEDLIKAIFDTRENLA